MPVDFCRHCGASVPPMFGEGTCPHCNPVEKKMNDELRQKQREIDDHVRETGYIDIEISLTQKKLTLLEEKKYHAIEKLRELDAELQAIRNGV